MRKTAVLYARYSSHNQREVSIEDQLRVCTEYCAREGIDVVGVYHDSAMTGTNDRRPDFQQMIANAPESDYIVVYMMERFSRDKYDAPIYKQQLERKGVRVLSALEYIPETPEGILIEKMIEGQAAYYSVKLSRDVLRGMNSNADKCMANGYRVFGYDIDPDTNKYVINEAEAAIVREVFGRYLNGETMNAIGKDLARRGYKTKFGNPVGYNFVSVMIHNIKYTGVYVWGKVKVVGGMPVIIDKATFDAAQDAPRRKVRADEEWTEFPLSGKLYCAICGCAMHGRSGRNRNGVKYLYYACKRDSGCDRKPVRKEVLEDALCEAIAKVADDESTARRIAHLVVERYGEGGETQTAVKSCKAKLKDNAKATKAIGDSIEKGIILPDTKDRVDRLNIERERLEAELGRLQAEELGMSEDDLTQFLMHGFSAHDDDILLGGFLNRVYLFDGYMVATLNFRDETNELAEVEVALDELRFEKQNPSSKGCLSVTCLAGPTNSYANIYPILLHNAIGIVIRIEA